MEKLIITVTVDSSMSYPGNPYMPEIEDTATVARQYIDAVKAGASIVHHHGVHHLEGDIQSDGKRLSRIDHEGWRELTDRVRAEVDAVIQFGIASARLEDKVALMSLGPEMMSFAFNVHDEYFQPDPHLAANEQYSLHPRGEIESYCRHAREHGVKPEIECFYTGAFWNVEYVRRQALLDDPLWTTLLLGWPGGAWTPPTPEALLYMLRYLPKSANWNLSVMDPGSQWGLLALAISLGGHCRVGWEDNPYLPNGDVARSNAELVSVVVRMAESMGREVATPEEARAIIGLSEPVRPA